MEREKGKMNKILKLILVLAVIAAFCVSAIRTSAYTADYTITEDNGEYVLLRGGEELFRSDKVSGLFEDGALTLGSTVNFENIRLSENLELSKSMKLCGTIAFSSGNLIISADAVLENLSLSFLSDNGIQIKKGELRVTESNIVSKAASAVSLEHSSLASLRFESGKISSESSLGTVNAKNGTLFFLGGIVENKAGTAVNSDTSIYLAGNARFLSGILDIKTRTPIYLSHDGVPFRGSLKISYLAEFERGTMTAVFFDADKKSIEKISLYDKNMTVQNIEFFEESSDCSERNFAAVYLPYTVNFICDGELISSQKLLSGDTVSNFKAPDKLGYEFYAWHLGSETGELFEFGKVAVSDMEIYGEYRLSLPTYSLDSLSFIYDGTEKELKLKELSHPLLGDAVINYNWYKNDEFISTASALKLKTTSDSGEYYCKLIFTYMGDSMEITTAAVSVNIEKFTVSLPYVEKKEYTGGFLYPDIGDTPYYTAEKISAVNVGVYPFTLTLKDNENYAFGGSQLSSINLNFEVVKAKNEWLVFPKVDETFEGEELVVRAESKFSSPTIMFSDKLDGEWSNERPKSAGRYFMSVSVPESDNYCGISEIKIEFQIKSDEIVGISLKTPPQKTEYYAFDELVLDGIEVIGTYKSGRISKIPQDELKREFLNGKYLSYGDKAIYVSSHGYKLSVPVNVKRTDYDVSRIVFADIKTVYSGSFVVPRFEGELPVGHDGVPLYAEIKLTASDVGVYTAELVFKSESRNYNIPPSLYSTVEIVPLEREVIWENSTFTYDGEIKKPIAYFYDMNGNKIYLTVDGGRSYAGKYTASAIYSEKNYNLLSTSIEYTINKADYKLGGVYWSQSEFVYDGGEKSVYVMGLPEGVSVVAYSDSRAENAGTYRAKVSLSYDTINYNPPEIPEFVWCIKKGSYDLSNFKFQDSTVIFDGNTHYPEYKGSVPVGYDGSSPTFTFDKGALHVSDGRVKVEIRFESVSPNYLSPEVQYAYVEVKPLGIYVEWADSTIIYSGALSYPLATSNRCEINVLGGETNAGEYTATATTPNSDYEILNPTLDYKIEKAENRLEEISVGTVYEGNLPSPTASVLAGDIIFKYYGDKELTSEIDPPDTVGVYYVVAYCEGDMNYKPVVSEPFRFEVFQLLPTEIFVEFSKSDFKAFDIIKNGDITVMVKYNSGSIETVDAEAVSIEYQNGDCLSVKNNTIKVFAMGFSEEILIDVKKADYDMSNVFWDDGVFIYDGTEKNIFINGLPEGVKAEEYTGNTATLAGEYTVSLKISYDAENYNEPEIPTGVLKIEKCAVKPPVILPAVYCGNDVEFVVENGDFYNYSKNLYRDAGEYSVKFSLKDSDNYKIEGTEFSDINVIFKIAPREIKIKIEDMKLALFEEIGEVKYTLTGEVLPGDELDLEFTFSDGKISCKTSNVNYRLDVEEGKIIYLKTFSERNTVALFFIILLLLIFILLILTLIFKRDRIRRYAYVQAVAMGKFGTLYKIMPIPAGKDLPKISAPDDIVIESGEITLENKKTEDFQWDEMQNSEQETEEYAEQESGQEFEEESEQDDEKLSEKETKADHEAAGNTRNSENVSFDFEQASEIAESEDEIFEAEFPSEEETEALASEEEIFGGIDADSADEMISDTLAKTLLHRSFAIKTFGRKKRIINVGVLSKSFTAGDNVDINRMKAMNLIPYDTAYIKVLAGGSIDKPLQVYANDFSLPAVKMIALAGGEAIKVKSIKIKLEGDPDE